MNFLKVAGMLLAGALVFNACDKDDDDNDANSLNATDQNFMTMAGYANLAEVDAGTIAASKSPTDSVSLFGSYMISEHGKAYTSLDSIGKLYNINVPTTADQEHMAAAARLQTLSGHTFDTAYINGQVIDHQKTIALFNDENANGHSQRLKDYVATYLPHVEMHYSMALSLQSKLK